MTWILKVFHPDGTEEVLRLHPPECRLGYGEECDIHVYEGSVSTVHAKFSQCRDGRWWVEDMGSTNGTWVEDVEVKVPLALSEGMRITFGDVLTEVGTKETPSA